MVGKAEGSELSDSDRLLSNTFWAFAKTRVKLALGVLSESD